MKLSFDFRIVYDGNFESIILQYFDLTKIQLFWSYCDFRTIRICADVQKTRLIVVSSNNIEIQWECDLTKFAGRQGDFYLF
jgi:hypothetical protein